jgi:phosphoribosylaminoimidazole-succinocarboxamide synthase
MDQILIDGSSKVFWKIAEGSSVRMSFKDDIHGAGRHSSISHTGHFRREFTYYFYRVLEKNGVFTHLTKDPLREDGIITHFCRPIYIEVLVRNVARGHWVDAHKVPLFEAGAAFSQPIIEFCVKEKLVLENGTVLDDPRIPPALAIELGRHSRDSKFRGHMPENEAEIEQITQMALAINRVYLEFMKAQNWILEDFKFEVGRVGNQIVLMDEISPDSSRVRDASGASLTKDLFRQKKSETSILQSYQTLAEEMKRFYHADLQSGSVRANH